MANDEDVDVDIGASLIEESEVTAKVNGVDSHRTSQTFVNLLCYFLPLLKGFLGIMEYLMWAGNSSTFV